MLSQNGLETTPKQKPESHLPDEISSLIFDLERDPIKALPLCLDDSSYLKNGIFSRLLFLAIFIEYDDITDIMLFKDDEFNDSGIGFDSGSSRCDRYFLEAARTISNNFSPVPEPLVGKNYPRKNVCQFCSKQYQSISGLKYHLKKAQNSCSVKFRARGPNFPLIPLPS